MKAQPLRGSVASKNPRAQVATGAPGSSSKKTAPKEKPEAEFLAKLGTQFKKWELNRYKHLDEILHLILRTVGMANVSRFYESKASNYLPFLKWSAGLLMLRCKTISDSDNFGLVQYFQKSNLRYLHYSLADWLLRHRIYSPTTEQLFEKANLKCREINVNFRYTDFITQKYGFRSPRIEKSIKRMLMPDVYCHLTKNQKLRLAAMLYQRKKDTLANKLVKNVGRAYILKNTTSPYIFNKIVTHDIYKDDYFHRGSSTFKTIVRTREKFERMLLDARDSFCLIGNAPTELNLGKGKLIDSKRLVIRINNYSLDFPDDYGTKQDIWVRVANNEIATTHAKSNQLTIIAGNNFATKRKDAANYLLPLMLMSKDYTIIPSHIFQELIGKLNGLPSTGLAVAYWIYKTIGPIPKEFLFGFSHLQESSNFKAHYFVDKEKAGVHLHEWDKEIRIFNQITQ